MLVGVPAVSWFQWRGLVVSLTGNREKASELRDSRWMLTSLSASGLADDLRLYKSPPPGRVEGCNRGEHVWTS